MYRNKPVEGRGSRRDSNFLFWSEIAKKIVVSGSKLEIFENE